MLINSQYFVTIRDLLDRHRHLLLSFNPLNYCSSFKAAALFNWLRRVGLNRFLINWFCLDYYPFLDYYPSCLIFECTGLFFQGYQRVYNIIQIFIDAFKNCFVVNVTLSFWYFLSTIQISSSLNNNFLYIFDFFLEHFYILVNIFAKITYGIVLICCKLTEFW